MPTLQSPLAPVIGERTAKRLAERLELSTVGELLRYYPRRYDQRGRLTDLAELIVGENATVWARVESVNDKHLGNRRGVKHLTHVVVSDGQRRLTCTFFNQPFWSKKLHRGMEVMVSGKVSTFNRTLQMSGPSLAQLGDTDSLSDALEVIESFPGGLIPIYPLTEGVTAGMLQGSVRQTLAVLGEIADPLPDVLLAERGMVDLHTALADVHRPRSRDDLDHALDRLRYDEALAIQLVLARRRSEAKQIPAQPCPRTTGGLLDAFDKNLPFTLTVGQVAVGKQIESDLGAAHPMNRLLQGEVGSGKTAVALRAMLQVIDAGRQAALLAPTEVLASQHARSLRAVLGPLGRGGELRAPSEATRITLLTGSLGAAARRRVLLDIASGEAGIAVGTHALLSEEVLFANLGLIVVDEQHRFGVEQRDTLRTKHPNASPPHVLVMTATPIPRTVAMTVYGDLETSTLSELPRGRSPIATTVVPVGEKPAWLDRVWRRVGEEVAAGHQVYVVCPKIGDGEGSGNADETGDFVDAVDGAAGAGGAASPGSGGSTAGRPPLAVLEVAAALRAGPLAAVRMEVLHGRLPGAEKDAVMRDFADGKIDVLVSTTVIEVGVDVPNATTMVVLDAERFGISQLHQLRGRVGRGTEPGLCLLVTESSVPGARARLDAVARTTDGFALAEADLELRREGDVLGTSQSGRGTSLRQLSLLRDREIIERARADAQRIVGDDPALTRWPGLAQLVDAVIAEDSQEYLEKG